MSEIDNAAKEYEYARNRLAEAAVYAGLITFLRKKGGGNGLYDLKAMERGTERIVDIMLAEGWV